MLGRWVKELQTEDGQAFRGNGKLTPSLELVDSDRAASPEDSLEALAVLLAMPLCVCLVPTRYRQ